MDLMDYFMAAQNSSDDEGFTIVEGDDEGSSEGTPE
jgi:hypothetical protein